MALVRAQRRKVEHWELGRGRQRTSGPQGGEWRSVNISDAQRNSVDLSQLDFSASSDATPTNCFSSRFGYKSYYRP